MLHKNEHCSAAMRKYLKLIKDCMLFAQHKDRELMHMVLRALNDICPKSNGSYNYYCLGEIVNGTHTGMVNNDYFTVQNEKGIGL